MSRVNKFIKNKKNKKKQLTLSVDMGAAPGYRVMYPAGNLVTGVSKDANTTTHHPPTHTPSPIPSHDLTSSGQA